MEEQELDPGDPPLNTGRFQDFSFPIGLHSYCISNVMVLMTSFEAQGTLALQASFPRQTETLGNSFSCYVQTV